MIGYLLSGGTILPISQGEIKSSKSMFIERPDGFWFSPLFQHLVSILEKQIEGLSFEIGVAGSRFHAINNHSHEEHIIRTIQDAGDLFGSAGFFQISDKMRSESGYYAPFRLEKFRMWEAFKSCSNSNAWLDDVSRILQWLQRSLAIDVKLAISKNTLQETEPAYEFVLMHPSGDQEYYVDEVSGQLHNQEIAGEQSRASISHKGFELGNSYWLDCCRTDLFAAHSVGLERLVGAIILSQPFSFLEWDLPFFHVDDVSYVKDLRRKDVEEFTSIGRTIAFIDASLR